MLLEWKWLDAFFCSYFLLLSLTWNFWVSCLQACTYVEKNIVSQGLPDSCPQAELKAWGIQTPGHLLYLGGVWNQSWGAGLLIGTGSPIHREAEMGSLPEIKAPGSLGDSGLQELRSLLLQGVLLLANLTFALAWIPLCL